ncbi:Seed maturation protein [Quillaja saponaria]|uniref:Seed maturation protein n=1 Tax=Quillaja saponaria TaxID=32244 RepID=A0AAD7VIE5_QUISA|nr:Seed maturation protein [Quillaja saponaria]
MAITEEEKVIAHESRKVKEAKAKMEIHEDIAQHAAEKLNTNHSHLYGHHEPHLSGTHHSQPEVGQHVPVVGTQGSWDSSPHGWSYCSNVSRRASPYEEQTRVDLDSICLI